MKAFKGNQKHLIIPNESKESEPNKATTDFINSLLMMNDRVAVQVEFQSLLDVYDRNAHIIYSVINRKSEIEDMIVEISNKYDFMYTTLVPEQMEGPAKLINEFGKNYIVAVIKMYIATENEDSELLKEAYVDYNTAFSDLFKTFIEIRTDNLKSQSISNDEPKDSNPVSDDNIIQINK